jgi:hypothetical protein
MIDGLVRPLVTVGLVAALVYMAVVQSDENARAAALTLGTSVVSFWFGTRQADKAADAAIAVAKQAAANSVATDLLNGAK